ncbi:TonB-dependent receptor domain-containing protein [Puia dinghuensis]|uniref:TonB-dependent receptor n=1 Tax=Puia dinghuensis TaxID=1792502 RepID=A0A8J2XR42_9BACT|nr:TonB-dependent receptor [Puia dinghuensis]GGA98170.1 TonB-dependent receptor [Puia dinghuensis]
MNRLYALLLALAFAVSALAQEGTTPADNNGRITGRIIDSVSHLPLEYATISLFKQKAAKPSGGAMTGNKGSFNIDGLTSGTYTLTVEIIGYGTRTIGPFVLDSKKPLLSLGDIPVGKKATDLQAVTVTAPRGLVENKLDKMVYNVEKDVTSLGGVATDVLKKVPMVSVDVDGNVDIMGNGNILFLINGRPSSIFGNNLADALQTIPASQIKSIEVITSPGAKYDAEGTGGIINIILKDNKLNGINGNLSVTGGSRLQNGSFNLNAKHGNFGMNAFFSGNAQLPSTTQNSSTRLSYDSAGNKVNSLTQDGSSRFLRNGFESGLGFEWTPDKRNTLSANIGYDNFGNHNQGSYQQDELRFTPPSTTAYYDLPSLVRSTSQFRAHSLDWSLRYKKTYAVEDKELDISFDGSEGRNHSSYIQSQSQPSGDSTFAGLQGNNTGQDHEANVRLDFVQPFGDKVRLETGGRVQIRQITSNSPVYAYDAASGGYPYDSSQSNALTYNRHVYAGYASLSFPVFNFLDVKGGLRFERTETDAGFSKAPNTTIPGYNTFAPSIILSHSFAGEQTLKLGYTRRIQRPDYRSLNPYVNASDPKNLTRGNPFLQPEIADNFDLTYSKSFDKGSAINVVLFYRRSSNDIQPFIQYYPSFTLGDSVYTDVSVSTPMNVGAENNTGANIFGSVPLGKKLNLRSNISVFNRYITTGSLGGNAINSFNYRINLNASYQVSSTFILEFFGNFNSARNEIQGRYPSFYSYNLAARKQFWNKKASIALTATNPFGYYVDQATALRGSDFTLNGLRRVPYQSFGLNFTYKFGHLEFKKDKEESNQQAAPPDTL